MSAKQTNFSINLNKPVYFPHELVEGTIKMETSKALAGKTLYLIVEGWELAQWEKKYQGNRKFHSPKGFYSIYSHKMEIFYFMDDKIEQKNWNFPFSFELNQKIPCSFEFHSPKMDAVIRYRISVQLDNESISCSQSFKVTQPPTAVSIPELSLKIPHVSFWFFSTGATNFKFSLNKAFFFLDEEIFINCEMDNSESEVEINSLDIKFKRKMQLFSEGQHRKKKRFVIWEGRKYLFLPAKHSKIINFQLKCQWNDHDKNIVPNVSGNVIKNSYYFKFVPNLGAIYCKFKENIKKMNALPVVMIEKNNTRQLFEEKKTEKKREKNKTQEFPAKICSISKSLIYNSQKKFSGYDYPTFNEEELNYYY